MKAYIILQDREQLLKAYGDHENIVTNLHIRVAYAPNQTQTGEWISDMLGTTTIIKTAITESGPRHGSLNQVSRTLDEVRRPLLTADEIMHMKAPKKELASGLITHPGDMLIFAAGQLRDLRHTDSVFHGPNFCRSSEDDARDHDEDRAGHDPQGLRLAPLARRAAADACDMTRRATTPREARRILATLGAVTVAIFATMATAHAIGVTINTTNSMPMGIWVATAPHQARRGDVALLCLPDTPTGRLGQSRGYIAPGPCPTGQETVLKTVAAQPGDEITLSASGISVNGTPLVNSAALTRDSLGRPLPAYPAGTYHVPLGEVWLVSSHNPRSFDSRYYGPVDATTILQTMRPGPRRRLSRCCHARRQPNTPPRSLGSFASPPRPCRRYQAAYPRPRARPRPIHCHAAPRSRNRRSSQLFGSRAADGDWPISSTASKSNRRRSIRTPPPSPRPTAGSPKVTASIWV